MIVSNELFSPQAYLEEVTGECYILQGDDDILSIREVLTLHGDHNKRIYKLKEVDKLINGDFVLVETGRYDEVKNVWRQELVWCEI